MDRAELKKAIEAILFSAGQEVEISRLSKALNVSENDVKEAAGELNECLDKNGSALFIIELDGAYQMCTRKETYEYLLKIVSLPRENKLTDVQLETLSIIAYKQPVTKLEIENIRGVNTDYVVNRLVELGLVEEKGRLEAPGRPFLFGTTKEFLRRFGLKDLSELPDIEAEKEESFKIEAEKEAGYGTENIIEIDT